MNYSRITINDCCQQVGVVTEAIPYPSTIDVSGLTGTISKVTVILRGVEHPNPDDLDVLLVGPGGQNALLMSDACGSQPLVAILQVNLGFDDAASASLPDDPSSPCVSDFFKPTNYTGTSSPCTAQGAPELNSDGFPSAGGPVPPPGPGRTARRSRSSTASAALP